jgi:hypothetical protein
MQEASFKEFISRPENKPAIEAHQQQEVQELVTLSERLQLQEASSKVRSKAGAHYGLCPQLQSSVPVPGAWLCC